MAKVYQFECASAFDNNENGVMDSNDYEEHIFSDDYKKKKQHILAAYRELPQERSKSVVKVAVALLAVMLISGTTLAYGSDLLDAFFREGKSNIDSKYLLTNLAETSYTKAATVVPEIHNDSMDYDVLNGDKSYDEKVTLLQEEYDDIDVDVLTVGKGKHTITVAYIITLNNSMPPEMAGYKLTDIYADARTLKIGGINEDVPDSNSHGFMEDGLMGEGSSKKNIGLASNQILIYDQYRWEDNIDISRAKDIEIIIDSIYGVYISENMDKSENPDSITKEMLSEVDSCVDAWKLTIPIPQNSDYEDCCYDINDVIEVYGNEYYISGIDVSPITLSVKVNVAKTKELNHTRYGVVPSMFDMESVNPEKVYIIMSDGKKIKWRDIGSSASTNRDSLALIDSLWFDVPIDPSQVAGVQVDGKLIMFEDYK